MSIYLKKNHLFFRKNINVLIHHINSQTSPYGGAVVGQSGYAPIQQPQTGYGQPVGMQQPPKVYGMPSQYGQASSAPGYGGRAPNQQYTTHASGWFSYIVYT